MCVLGPRLGLGLGQIGEPIYDLPSGQDGAKGWPVFLCVRAVELERAL